MKTANLQVIELISWAMNHPDYLKVGTDRSDCNTWLCHFVWNNQSKNKEYDNHPYSLDQNVVDLTGEKIKRSIENEYLLYKFLDFKEQYITEEYRERALNHWKTLIHKLKEE